MIHSGEVTTKSAKEAGKGQADISEQSVPSRGETTSAPIDLVRSALEESSFSQQRDVKNDVSQSSRHGSSPTQPLFSSIAQSISWIKQAGVKLFAEQIAVNIAEKTLPLATAWFGAKLVPLAFAVHSTGEGLTELYKTLGMMAVCGAMTLVLVARRSYLESKSMFRTFHVLHREIMMAGIDLSPKLLGQATIQNKITKLRENVHSLQSNVYAVASSASEFVVLAITAISLAPTAPTIAGMVALLGIWRVSQAHRLGIERSITEDIIAEPRRQLWYSSWPVRDPAGIESTKHLLRASQSVELAISEMAALDETAVFMGKRAAKLWLRNDVAVLATTTIASAYGLFGYIAGDFKLEAALFLTAAAGIFSAKMTAFTQTIGSWVSTRPFVDEAIALINAGRVTRQREREVPAEQIRRHTTAPSIQLLNASVRAHSESSSESRTIIKDVSLTIHSGEFVAVVGKTGAGKTTLVKLILGNLEPSNGEVRFDQRSVREIPLTELRANTSYLPQIFWNYQGRSVLFNIMMGNPIWEPDKSITDALENSGLNAVMSANGFSTSTVVGPEFKNGREFSGGEWQLIALARSLAKDGKLIILDEPTSRLDVDTAKLVTDHIRGMQNHTRILITHDIGLAKQCDRIVVLTKENPDDDNSPGVVEAVGTHEELLKLSATYQRFYSGQAQRFS